MSGFAAATRGTLPWFMGLEKRWRIYNQDTAPLNNFLTYFFIFSIRLKHVDISHVIHKYLFGRFYQERYIMFTAGYLGKEVWYQEIHYTKYREWLLFIILLVYFGFLIILSSLIYRKSCLGQRHRFRLLLYCAYCLGILRILTHKWFATHAITYLVIT